jgi:hypothetical protein
MPEISFLKRGAGHSGSSDRWSALLIATRWVFWNSAKTEHRWAGERRTDPFPCPTPHRQQEPLPLPSQVAQPPAWNQAQTWHDAAQAFAGYCVTFLEALIARRSVSC